MNPNLKDMVAANRIGWFAIRHKEGWWVGTEAGVTCYATHEIAKAALTIVWQRDGGETLNFRIAEYTGADLNSGEYEPEWSAEEAMERYRE